MDNNITLADAKVLFELGRITQEEFQLFVQLKEQAFREELAKETQSILTNTNYEDATIQMK